MSNGYKKTILKYLNMMENYIVNINKGEDREIILENFNSFVDLFVSIDKIISLDNDLENEVMETNIVLRNSLVDFIEKYNKDPQIIFLIMLERIKDEFYKWFVLLKKYLKYRILIFGVNPSSPLVDKIIDVNKANIICYIDDTNEYSGKYINGIQVIDVEHVFNLSFDYIFSISNNEQSVNKLKANTAIESECFIDYIFFVHLIVSSPEFYIKYFDFLSMEKKFSGILTGLSYVQKGVNEKLLRGNFFNLANPAQDLFYDFELFKYVYSFNDVQKNLKYAIIGLSYYSFHYDLSKSVNESSVNYYYPITGTMHNNKLADNYLLYHHQLEGIAREILKETHFLALVGFNKDHFNKIISDSYVMQYDCKAQTEEKIQEDIASVKRDYNKNYPITVLENKQILRDYLDFLKINSIKPIILVCPVTNLYRDFTPPAFQCELYEIISELSLQYEFQFLDYYYSEEFIDSDFYDCSHINSNGSNKLANILNRDIIW